MDSQKRAAHLGVVKECTWQWRVGVEGTGGCVEAAARGLDAVDHEQSLGLDGCQECQHVGVGAGRFYDLHQRQAHAAEVKRGEAHLMAR